MVNHFAINGHKRDVGKAHFIGNEFFLQFMDGIQLGGIKAKLSGILNGTECSLSQFYADAVEAKYRQAKQEITPKFHIVCRQIIS